MKTNKIAIFEGKKIRRHWDEEKELWYFSVVDIISTLTGSENPQVYWRVLKKRLIDEGSNETVTKCNGLKMLAADGKMRLTDVADTKTMLRLIQSIPSPNAEPFKRWLASVGYERLEETADPELAINRALKTRVARESGTIAGNARKQIEKKTGKKVVSSENYLQELQDKRLLDR